MDTRAETVRARPLGTGRTRGPAAVRTGARRALVGRPADLSQYERRRPAGADGQLESSAAFAPRARLEGASFWRPRPVLIAIALVVATVGYWVNVPGRSPLDLLPLSWGWFSLWLMLNAGAWLWEQHLGPPRPRRRRPSVPREQVEDLDL